MSITEIILASIVGIIITYFIFRWIFSVDKMIFQNKSIINLLMLIARQQGVTEDEIFKATRSSDQIHARERRLKEELKKAESKANLSNKN